MAYPFVIAFAAASVTAIAAAQTLGGAGALSINGPLISAQDFGVGVRRAVIPNAQRVVTLTSTGNLSGANITVVGTDTLGNAVTETRAGPNNNTVATTAQFATVTSVTSDAALGTAMSVGTGSTGSTAVYKIDRFQNPISIGISSVIAATVSWSVQYTYDNPETVTSPTWISVPGLNAITATLDGTFGSPAMALRGIMNSSSGSGAATMTITQAAGAK